MVLRTLESGHTLATRRPPHTTAHGPPAQCPSVSALRSAHARMSLASRPARGSRDKLPQLEGLRSQVDVLPIVPALE
eukprot:6783607-Prymnesium_polylepis.1